MTKQKLLKKAIASPNNLSFKEFVALVEAFGFRLSRVRGSHHIFVHSHARELANLQNVDGKSQALPGAAVSQADRK
ncbi:MAG: hypothetical protein HW412_260 [Bacteroidetes bacterium]|nr:hypothetical protein [Bacteroidota bacterium]